MSCASETSINQTINQDVVDNWNHIALQIEKNKHSLKSGGCAKSLSIVTNIQVAVRVRPLNENEKNQQSIISIHNDTVTLDESSRDHCDSSARAGALTASSALASFTFDHVFGDLTSQADIFRIMGRDMVKDALLGFNCSVFAYGQTSSGKSHTMTGGVGVARGLLPRICECLFYGIEQLKISENKHFAVQASYYEIYNEKVFDLLNPQCNDRYEYDGDGILKRKSLNVREDKKAGVFVDGLLYADIDSIEDANVVMAAGLGERTVQTTKMNSSSSRSHAIFILSIVHGTLSVTSTCDDDSSYSSNDICDMSSVVSTSSDKTSEEVKERNETLMKPWKKKRHVEIPKTKNKVADSHARQRVSQTMTNLQKLKLSKLKLGYRRGCANSRLSLIDLAGSERAKATGAEGGRLTESNNINSSLSTLGRCISALVKKAKGGGKNTIIPFRDSVLTWLLRESLAGNARTRMMASVSPALINAKETISTLRYARSAKMITTKATVAADPKERRIMFLASEVSRLKAELLAFKALHTTSQVSRQVQQPLQLVTTGTLLKNDLVQPSSHDCSINDADASKEHSRTPKIIPRHSKDALGDVMEASRRHGHVLREAEECPTTQETLVAELVHELELLTNEKTDTDDCLLSVDLITNCYLSQKFPCLFHKDEEATSQLLMGGTLNTPDLHRNNNNNDGCFEEQDKENGSCFLYTPRVTLSESDLQKIRSGWFNEVSHGLSMATSMAPKAIISNLSSQLSLNGKFLLAFPYEKKQNSLIIEGKNVLFAGENIDMKQDTVLSQHCVIEYLNDNQISRATTVNSHATNNTTHENSSGNQPYLQAFVTPLTDDKGNISELYVNGVPISLQQALFHGDRLVVGPCVFVGVFIESPHVLIAKLKQYRKEWIAQLKGTRNLHSDEEQEVIDMIRRELARNEWKINQASHSGALGEVSNFNTGVAKENDGRQQSNNILSFYSAGKVERNEERANCFNNTDQVFLGNGIKEARYLSHRSSMSTISSNSSERETTFSDMEERAVSAERKLEAQRLKMLEVYDASYALVMAPDEPKRQPTSSIVQRIKARQKNKELDMSKKFQGAEILSCDTGDIVQEGFEAIVGKVQRGTNQKIRYLSTSATHLESDDALGTHI